MQAPSSHKAELELGPLDEAGPPEDERDDGPYHELQEGRREMQGGNTGYIKGQGRGEHNCVCGNTDFPY